LAPPIRRNSHREVPGKDRQRDGQRRWHFPDGTAGNDSRRTASYVNGPGYESNASDGLRYEFLKEALVKGWRTVFENDKLSFYWGQLANFQYANTNPAGGGWEPVREGQRRSLRLPHTGMAVNIDIGAARDIHPRNKQDVGARLALAKDYGRKPASTETALSSGPRVSISPSMFASDTNPIPSASTSTTSKVCQRPHSPPIDNRPHLGTLFFSSAQG
tara:strand:- start:9465 stop:10115 length:651 start_codon:yes stop_codon:yes gene_type:complete